MANSFEYELNLKLPSTDGFRSLTASVQRLEKELGDAQGKLNGLTSATQKASESSKVHAGQILKTVGQYVSWGLALREVTKQFSGVIQYLGRLETSKLGIQSLLTSFSVLGKTDPLKQFKISGQDSEVIIDLLKEKALKTTATFEELSQGFQASLSGGLAKGLDPKQIVEFSTVATQALGAMGIPLDQIGQEVRAIFDGDMSKNSRLNQSLRIDKETLAGWQNQGVLFEELMKKMKAFSVAGDATANTLAGLTSNFGDFVQQALGTLGEDAFASVKNTIKDFTAFLSVNPEKSALGKGLKNVLDLLADGVGGASLAIQGLLVIIPEPLRLIAGLFKFIEIGLKAIAGAISIITEKGLNIKNALGSSMREAQLREASEKRIYEMRLIPASRYKGNRQEDIRKEEEHLEKMLKKEQAIGKARKISGTTDTVVNDLAKTIDEATKRFEEKVIKSGDVKSKKKTLSDTVYQKPESEEAKKAREKTISDAEKEAKRIANLAPIELKIKDTTEDLAKQLVKLRTKITQELKDYKKDPKYQFAIETNFNEEAFDLMIKDVDRAIAIKDKKIQLGVEVSPQDLQTLANKIDAIKKSGTANSEEKNFELLERKDKIFKPTALQTNLRNIAGDAETSASQKKALAFNAEMEDAQKRLYSGVVSVDQASQNFATNLVQNSAISKQSLDGIALSMADGIGSAFNDMITGSQSFAKAIGAMTVSILKDISRIIFQQLILNAIQGIVGGTPTAKANGGKIQKFSEGGNVYGAGTATSDSIPALLSNGEYVIKASSTKNIGDNFLNFLNKTGKVNLDLLPSSVIRRADGGSVGESASSLAPTSSAVTVNVINNSSASVRKEEKRSPDGKTALISIILEDLGVNGPISQGIQGRYGLRRAVA
jgi:hypothetical protein